jgi:hypothetical protein
MQRNTPFEKLCADEMGYIENGSEIVIAASRFGRTKDAGMAWAGYRW